MNSKNIGKIFGGANFTLDPNLCFVVMPFKKSLNIVYETSIRKVVNSHNLSCIRADEIVGTNLITWDVWEKINRARVIIADLTGKNPNVFYEVGLAHAIGKDVILLTQTIDDVPFDLAPIRCIEYDLRSSDMKSMERRLKLTIGKILHSS